MCQRKRRRQVCEKDKSGDERRVETLETGRFDGSKGSATEVQASELHFPQEAIYLFFA
jgi:hypothetical protein